MAWRALWPLDGLARPLNPDACQMVWNLWIGAEALCDGRSPLHTDLVYAPLGANLATHAGCAGYAPFAALVKLATHSHPLYPLFAYHLATWLSLALLLYFTQQNLRALEHGFWARWLPSVAITFGAFVDNHLEHLNLLSLFLVPLATGLLMACWRSATRARLVAAGTVLGGMVWFSEFSLLSYVSIVSFVALLALRRQGRWALSNRLRRLRPWDLAAAILAFAVVVGPFVLAFTSSEADPPAPRTAEIYSANLAGLFLPAPGAPWIYGDLFRPWHERITLGRSGVEAFVGFPFLLFVITGLRRFTKRGAVTRALVGVLVFLVGLSLGPRLQVLDFRSDLRLPFDLLRQIPPFEQSRTPVRFLPLALFLSTFPAAVGIERLLTMARARPRVEPALAFLLAIWTVAEAWTPLPVPEPFRPPPQVLDRNLRGPVLTLPYVPANAGLTLLLQTVHGRPTSTGYVTRLTRAQRERSTTLKRAMKNPNRLRAWLEEQRVQTVLVLDELPAALREAVDEVVPTVVDLTKQPSKSADR